MIGHSSPHKERIDKEKDRYARADVEYTENEGIRHDLKESLA
jgi:hypothetical protein